MQTELVTPRTIGLEIISIYSSAIRIFIYSFFILDLSTGVLLMPFKMAASVAPNVTLPATRNNTEIFNTTSTLLVTTATTTINTLANYTSSLTNTRSNLSTTHKPIFTDAQSSDCQSFEYDFHKNIPVSAVCGFCFIIGIMLVFVGK